MMNNKEILLKIGEDFTVKRGFLTKITMVYAGMPNKETYSIAITYTSGYNSLGNNLFYPLSRRRIRIAKKEFEIIRITPDAIGLMKVE